MGASSSKDSFSPPPSDDAVVRTASAKKNPEEELKITRGNDTNNMLILCHYPIISWNQMHHGSFMLHGHQHLKGEKIFGQGKRMDIGMCGSEEFRPYHMEEIVDLLKNRQFEPYIEHDHHTTKIK